MPLPGVLPDSYAGFVILRKVTKGNLGLHFSNVNCAVDANFLKGCCVEYKSRGKLFFGSSSNPCTPTHAKHESSPVSFEGRNERKYERLNKICISVAKVTNYVDEQPQLRILLHVHTFLPITTMPNMRKSVERND